MYRSRYSLIKKPFGQTPDSSQLWRGASIKAIVNALKKGVYSGHGLHLVTGDEGVGKSVLLDILDAELGSDVRRACVDVAELSQLNFYNSIIDGFGLEKGVDSKVQFLIDFSHFLRQSAVSGDRVLLVLDNAQYLVQDMLDEVRMLSSIEKDDGKLLNILLVGRPEFTAILAQPKNRVMRRRLAYRVDMKPLSFNEVSEYIQFRCIGAGAAGNLFPAEAVRFIHQYSGGLIGNINALCEKVLLAGAENECGNIDLGLVKACAGAGGDLPSDAKVKEAGKKGVPALRFSSAGGDGDGISPDDADRTGRSKIGPLLVWSRLFWRHLPKKHLLFGVCGVAVLAGVYFLLSDETPEVVVSPQPAREEIVAEPVVTPLPRIRIGQLQIVE